MHAFELRFSISENFTEVSHLNVDTSRINIEKKEGKESAF